MSEANKALVRRYFQDAPCRPAAYDEILAPRFLFHTIRRASPTPQTMESGPTDERAAYERIKVAWDISDRLWMWQQLGVLPSISEAVAKAREATAAQTSGKEA